jgi:HD-like signal output (HDOD) protein
MSNPAVPQKIFAEMLEKGTLRALDKNVQDVCAIIASAESSFADLSEAIMRDAALSTNLLSMANSAHYSGVEQVRTISAAVIRLGFEKIRALALGLALFKQAGQNARTPDLYRMYAGTYFAGSMAMELLRRKGYGNPEEGFVAGLLMQLPRLILANTFPQRYKEAERIMAAEEITFDEACRRVFGVEYGVVRTTVLEHWRLLDQFRPSLADSGSDPSADARGKLIQKAGELADVLFGNSPGGETKFAEMEKDLGKLMDVESFSAGDFIHEASDRDDNIQRFFKLNAKDVEMMVKIAQWGRVSTAQIAASLTLGSAQSELDEGGEAPEISIGNYLTEMVTLSRRGEDINHLLLLAQEAAFRCLRPSHVILALLDTSQTTLRGRFSAGAKGKVQPSDLTVVMSRKDSPIVQCMQARASRRCEVKGEGWDSQLIEATQARFVLMAPIVAHDRAIGLHFLARTDEPAFSKQEQSWCEAILGNLAFAFERHR